MSFEKERPYYRRTELLPKVICECDLIIDGREQEDNCYFFECSRCGKSYRLECFDDTQDEIEKGMESEI